MKMKTGMGAAAAVLLCAGAGSADVLEFNIDTRFGDHESFQADGYVNVKLVKVGSNVELTIKSFLEGSSASEKLSGLYLNFDEALDLGGLAFTNPQKGAGSDFELPGVGKSRDSHRPDGDGFFDILLSFDTSTDSEFNAGDELTYLLTYDGPEAFSAKSFEFLSKPASGEGNPGPFYGAGHIQGIGPTAKLSGWHSATLVPLPAPAYLGLAGLGLAAGVSVIKRRR